VFPECSLHVPCIFPECSLQGELQSFPLGEKEPKEKESKGDEKEGKMEAKAERKSARLKALVISNAAFVVPILMEKVRFLTFKKFQKSLTKFHEVS
jgi:hypothetical protein